MRMRGRNRLVVCTMAFVVAFFIILNGYKMMDDMSAAHSSDRNLKQHQEINLADNLKHIPPQTLHKLGPTENTASIKKPKKNILKAEEQVINFTPNLNKPPQWQDLPQHILEYQARNKAGFKIAQMRIPPIDKLQNANRQHKPANTKCLPRKNIVFLKTHKCGSSTVQNILFRYGEKRDLNFVLPPVENYLLEANNRGASYFNKKFMLQIPTKEYNILSCHTRFSERGMDEVMPKDSVYVSILREPITMFESIFTYRKFSNIYHIKGPNPLKQFLSNPNRYYSGQSHTKNPMLFDFGLDNIKKDDQYHIDNIIEQIDRRFDLIMIMEYFHQSLILFKELMCWSMDDIVYFTLNARSKASILTDITPKMKDQIKQWNLGDVELYDHFNKTFWRKVREFGVDRMEKEIKELKERNDHFYKKCVEKVRLADERVWHPPGIKVESFQLKLTAQNDPQCVAMARTEVPYVDHLRKKMKAKYYSTGSQNNQKVQPKVNRKVHHAFRPF